MMNRRKTINPRLLLANHQQQQSAEDDVDLDKIDNFIRNQFAIIELTDIREKQSRLKSKEKELLENLDQLEKLKIDFEKLFNEYSELRKQLRRYRLLSRTLLQAENVEKFAIELQHHCTEQKIPIEDDEKILQTLSNTIQSYQTLSDENLLENIRKFQQKILEILGKNFQLQNHPESYQHIKRLLNECKEQWQCSENLTTTFNEFERIRQWIKLHERKK
uniref:Uncharacterized protein LOC113792439 n=1 Tax=Dermatophagoides pteronyssinus TaxID=6956 RepID=A0A6P6XY78_DERPT|nr:uncharacterized protein LOC113792439 [Dermatophagoides pteronyssinus]